MPVIASPADGVPLRYDLTGTADGDPAAPALVLLHGSVLSRAIWRGLGYLGPLSAEHRVIRLDLRGHGRSGTPHEPSAYTQDRFVADLLGVLDAEGIERAALMGYSLGARVALSTALAHPERVTALISLGGSAAAQHGALDSVFFPGVIDTVREEGMGAFADRQGLTADRSDRRGRSTREAFLTADAAAMAALFTATDATPAVPEAELAACTVPALWMAGSEDHPRLEDSRAAAATMPRARFAELPDRDHGGTLWPAEPVLEQVTGFLRELREDPASR